MTYTDEQLQQIITRHGPFVWRFALAQLCDPAAAEDIYEEVFLRLVRSDADLESPAQKKAWLIRETVRCCQNHLKNCRPKANANATFAPERLPEKYRPLIFLYYYEGHETEEIASLLGMTASAVRSNLKRAQKRLESLMEGAFIDV